MYDFIVIGGGPAGMMAAGRAGERGKRVILLEKKDRMGKKLLLCATGRCNVTNTASLEVFIRAYGKGGNFLRTALETFDNEKLRSLLLSYGVETVVENKGRVFPKSQNSNSILKALETYMYDHHVKIQTNSQVLGLKLENNRVSGVETNHGDILGKNVLVATGGLSYPATGSTGDGYKLAASAGHTICPTYPAIIAFETVESWVKSLQGTPIKNVHIAAYQSGKKIAEQFGEALFTHYGLSGPTILDMSKRMVECLQDGPVQIRIDLKPKHSPEELEGLLLDQIKRHGSKAMKSCLSFFIPEKLTSIFLNLCNLEPNKKVSQITVSERRKILKQLKGLCLTLIRHRPIEEAIVTAGGVNLNEVNAKTMESKLLEGLYFAGEVLDIDGPTGGFNLQAAFSTGYLAGNSVD
ncbi:MAG: NAD(P)/FAD-dependent oxidoreductase [Planctomycetia bacterium]|nr:NAD(P)/FAD-dependent oxidoreductase [Candidatus Brocadia sp.]QOJ07079.1 MAG: NAD(P)/FAD-dependent oxidoreductase [Planctomycetia bacterium]TVL94671.1 MAG: aminoacetone oxidase family FAD-binding enzyme [Candidatus Brocadia sp. BL1]HQU32485.1 NAD(P)/FAD-dependent oxidoreductase [Candidatus Brocadia sapporoensis]